MLKQSQLDLCGRVDFTREVPLLGRDEAWVQEILKNFNCRVQDVYLLTSEPDGKLYFAAMREDEA